MAKGPRATVLDRIQKGVSKSARQHASLSPLFRLFRHDYGSQVYDAVPGQFHVQEGEDKKRRWVAHPPLAKRFILQAALGLHEVPGALVDLAMARKAAFKIRLDKLRPDAVLRYRWVVVAPGEKRFDLLAADPSGILEVEGLSLGTALLFNNEREQPWDWAGWLAEYSGATIRYGLSVCAPFYAVEADAGFEEEPSVKLRDA